MQIIANRAPVGFEAEFVNQRGRTICYRGILMPFASDGDTIDFIYGVINWKDVGEARRGAAGDPRRRCRRSIPSSTRRTKRTLEPTMTRSSWSCRCSPSSSLTLKRPRLPHLAWEDGPLADPEPIATADADEDEPGDRARRRCRPRRPAVGRARKRRGLQAADGRSRVALYRALAMAYDFAVAAKRVPDDYAEMLEDAGVKAQARAPMTPIVKLVFGIDYDKTRLTEFAAALSYAERAECRFRRLPGFRRAGRRRPQGAGRGRAQGAPPGQAGRRQGRSGQGRASRRPAAVAGQLPTNQEFALVLTRRNADGVHEVVALVADEAMLDRAIRRAAR